ncbi:hypothetical protein A2U01_0068683, partial [Trifolium medium]|nr:hypothetical protein [Trifolium medium]
NNNDVFIDESDIVHEVASDDDEVLPDADANDADVDGDGSSDPDGMNFGPVWIDLLEFIISFVRLFGRTYKIAPEQSHKTYENSL